MSDFLFYTWVTVFFFNLAIPTGKVAVAAFLIDMNAQTSNESPPHAIILDAKSL